MTKILQASAEKSKVQVKAGIIKDCQILSAGIEKSKGIVILNENEKVYIAMPIESIKSVLDLITKLADIANNLASKLSADIMPSNQGGPVAPQLAADMSILQSQISQYKSELSKLKENLQ